MLPLPQVPGVKHIFQAWNHETDRLKIGEWSVIKSFAIENAQKDLGKLNGFSMCLSISSIMAST